MNDDCRFDDLTGRKRGREEKRRGASSSDQAQSSTDSLQLTNVSHHLTVNINLVAEKFIRQVTACQDRVIVRARGGVVGWHSLTASTRI